MSNKRMNLSQEGKQMLDEVAELLEIDRPQSVKIALAKGISISQSEPNLDPINGGNKWTIPDNVIKDQEFTLFKHLIINEAQRSLNDDELHQYMLAYIEQGLREIKRINESKTSMEDIRLMII
ncbi:hypothetical protein NDQ57_01915 [Rossellomorea marisflavi]|uniref:hypothetical protein n=1 Tax=Rossellomorea marisflavi TaxID=189381 RepID=UPI00203AC8E8|nr:hypothetical protein [Rossellomorea marisflavi]MCM2603460.1 hypothetical protein [Rossellomorea marisflavi]